MDRHCKTCGQKNECQEVYARLGSSKQPPVLKKVFMAFLLPMILFIVTVAAAEKVFAEKIGNSAVKGLSALAAAVAVIGLYLIVLKLWRFKH